MKKLLLLLLVSLVGSGSSLYGQGTPKKDTGPTVQELLQKVIELQGRLIECQNTAKPAAPSPIRDLLEAFQTFDSVLSVGYNYPSYKDALIALKVRSDRLPDNAETVELRKNVQRFMDAETLWYRSMDIAPANEPFSLKPYTIAYQKEWTKTEEEWKRDGGKPCLKAFGHDLNACMLRFSRNLIEQGRENIKGFPKP